MSRASLPQKIGLALLFAWVLIGVVSLAPVWEVHGEHHSGDEVRLYEVEHEGPVAEAIEPATDLYRYLVSPAVSSAHSDFEKFCGHYAAAIPNHNYYYYGHSWQSGTHYHRGLMSHVVGADYNYRFKCGFTRSDGSRKHYVPWPQR